ncbi:MAG TPA: phosphoribosylaminoimidazolesuccinocarboxamide synthase [Bdellovibrionota bacterium]|jgi:phosphoribosylamine--glycine ligase|nr:phosphoribosylaminoimidazolesuccinocarboxamide synthase [Bdellovibrionota bacterium]
MSLELVRKGSSKDIYSDSQVSDELFFQFSDRVSVFDYGPLPDLIPKKSQALFKQAIYFNNLMRKHGVGTLTTKFDHVRTGYWQKKALHATRTQNLRPNEFYFLPIEFVFRWGLPRGSSYLKRFPELGVGYRFDEVVVETFTKLEDQDRLLDDREAQTLLPPGLELESVRGFVKGIAKVLLQDLATCELTLWDGKVELAWCPGTNTLALVDAIGLDELRVTHPLMPQISLSKEILRQWLQKTYWATDLTLAKKFCPDDWRKRIYAPPRLGTWRAEKIAAMYEAFAVLLDEKNSKPLLDWMRFDSTKPRVYVQGGGGREAALRWRLREEGCEVLEAATGADAVFVSMDADLEAGMVDDLSEKSVWAYGPKRDAAKIEWSKSFGREVAVKAGIPGPRVYHNFDDARRELSDPPVVKKNSLAAGKGVVVCESWDEAKRIYDAYSADDSVVIEEKLSGPEASVFFAVDAQNPENIGAVYLGSAKDYKRRFEGDLGPNTGGMGAWAPHPLIKDEDVDTFRAWVQAFAKVLLEKNVRYQGVVFLGLMKDRQRGWSLLEFNARFGDPETQAIVAAWGTKKVLRSLLGLSIETQAKDQGFDGKSICLSLVHPDYPGKVKSGLSLGEWNLPSAVASPVRLFKTTSTTGRLAYLVGTGDSFTEAADEVFATLSASPWKDAVAWRKDILP